MPLKRIRTPSLAACLVWVVLGCGGGSDGGDTSTAQAQPCQETSIHYCPVSALQDPLGIALSFAWWSGQCTREVVCRSDLASQPETSLENGIVRDDYVLANWLTTELTDREPNDDLETAVPFVLRARSGVRVDGTVVGGTDPTDVFSFISETDDLLSVYICASADDCIAPQSTSPNLSLRVYDQGQNLIATTEGLVAVDQHAVNLPSTHGQRFYVAVSAHGGDGVSRPYRLRITD